MNTTDHDAFDQRLRALHAQALAHVPPHTLARLRPVRTRPAPVRHWGGWTMAAACAVGVLAIGLQWRRELPSAPAAPVVATAPATQEAYDPFTDFDENVVVLDENPDLYLWLASSEAAALAME